LNKYVEQIISSGEMALIYWTDYTMCPNGGNWMDEEEVDQIIAEGCSVGMTAGFILYRDNENLYLTDSIVTGSAGDSNVGAVHIFPIGQIITVRRFTRGFQDEPFHREQREGDGDGTG
jgi:hypothetical protein